MPLSLKFSALSDIGRTRKKNDDSGYAGPHLAMIADGMGGAPAGDLASAVAVQTLRRLDTTAPDDLLEALAGAVHRANDRLAELIAEDSAVEGMGTTVTAMLFDGQRIGVAHLGDSRGYLWRDGELLRITRDHSWVQSLIDEGRITEEEAKVHSHRSLLLKVLDGRHDTDPDLTVYDVQAGDRILLCSDGLSGFVEHDRIERVLSIGTVDSVARELLQLALEAASTDNITVVVADVVDEVVGDEPAPLVVGSATDEPRGTLSRLRTWGHREERDPSKSLYDPDVDPEELRYAPREPKRFRWLKRGLLLIVVLVLVGFLGKMSYDYTQRQYYVSADSEHVVIYKGIQADLPGIDLHEVYQKQELRLSELPSFRRSQVVEGMQADDLEDAREIVQRLATFAETCATQATVPPTATTASTPTQTRTATRTPTRTPATGQPGGASQGPRGTQTTPRPTTPSEGEPTSGGQSSDSTDGDSPEECSGATPLTQDAPLTTQGTPPTESTR